MKPTKQGDPQYSTHQLMHRLDHIFNQGEALMASFQELEAKVAELTQVEKDREARDTAQDAVTSAQIAALQKTIDDLNAAGGLSPANQAILDASVASLQAVVDSLNAADPTPPVVVPPAPPAA